MDLLLACINKLRAFDENLAGRFQLARSETATSGHGGNGAVSAAPFLSGRRAFEEDEWTWRNVKLGAYVGKRSPALVDAVIEVVAMLNYKLVPVPKHNNTWIVPEQSAQPRPLARRELLQWRTGHHRHSCPVIAPAILRSTD
ncbi:hypothetical protein [Sinorhizobium meliloti]